MSDPGKYHLLAARADAWVEAITAAGLGEAEPVDPAAVSWVDEQHLEPSRVTVVRGPAGTQRLVVGLFADETFVQVGIGDPVEVLERQPVCGCDACDDGSAALVEAIDNAFVLALSGGVHAVRDGANVVRRSLDGWGSSGTLRRRRAGPVAGRRRRRTAYGRGRRRRPLALISLR